MIVFKLPNDSAWYTVVPKATNQAPVEIISFDVSVKAEFFGTVQEISLAEVKWPITLPDFHPQHQNLWMSQEDYVETIERLKRTYLAGPLEKIVLSRRKFKPGKINLPHFLSNLASTYPQAFVYFFQHGNAYWVGAFSEVLGIYDTETENFSTMSLAGTLPLDEDWSAKEHAEQQTVTTYLATVLSAYGKNIQQSAVLDHISGKIKHLRTDFSCTVPQAKVCSLIDALHPTPATCGSPKEMAYEAVLATENCNREFYSGYAKVEVHNKHYYFVLLRCAKVYDNGLLLFAGGGLNKASNAHKEWQETELKTEAIGQFIPTTV